MLTDEHTLRVQSLLDRQERVVLGITGCPGAGKSTTATEVTAHFASRGIASVWVPMDGFHLADIELERLGRSQHKGAIDTFDSYGYRALLERVATEKDNIVYAPAFERTLEQPIAGSIPVPPGTRLVVTEGNYLLDDAQPWPQARRLIDETWFVHVDDEIRRNRLVRRHVLFGKTPEDARAWVLTVDEPNAERIARRRGTADLIITPELDESTADHLTQGDA